jgi:hypothetical protein
MWVALYDILLEWIDPEHIYFHQEEAPTLPSMRTPRVMANAYADDLATLNCGHAAFYRQQQQADWLSAFCVFSGLQLHPDKIVKIKLEKKSLEDQSTSLRTIIYETKLPVKLYDVMGNLKEDDNINLENGNRS